MARIVHNQTAIAARSHLNDSEGPDGTFSLDRTETYEFAKWLLDHSECIVQALEFVARLESLLPFGPITIEKDNNEFRSIYNGACVPGGGLNLHQAMMEFSDHLKEEVVR